MFPRGYVYYTVNTPIYYFFIFLIGYILGRANKDFTLSIYKLLLLLLMFFLLHIVTHLFTTPILQKIGRRYIRKPRRSRFKKKMRRAPEEYYERI